MIAPPALALERITLRYSDNDEGPLLQDFSIQMEAGQITALMGGSGSGKSTLARIAAQRQVPGSGAIRRRPDFEKPSDVVYVDQDPWNSIFPRLTVAENLEWTLKILGWSTPKIQSRVENLLRTFSMSERRHAFPKTLSGGERQRLALMRCLSWGPKCLLLDETLSALDQSTKNNVIASLLSVVREDGITLLVVTHILFDALAMADRIIVIGRKPVEILGEVLCRMPHPRNSDSREYGEAEASLLTFVHTANK